VKRKKCVQKQFDRTDIVRDGRLPKVNGWKCDLPPFGQKLAVTPPPLDANAKSQLKKSKQNHANGRLLRFHRRHSRLGVQQSGAKRGLKGELSEKCVETEVPVHFKSVRIKLVVCSQGCEETIRFTRKGLGCTKVPIRRSKLKSRVR
jgi:hypothetical protein